ncbi:MAG TPA: hypothetical protein VII38_19650, partial [Polyangia bacterium]
VKWGQQPLQAVRGEIDWLSPPPPMPLKSLKPGETTYIWFGGFRSIIWPNTSLDYPLPGPGTYTAVFAYVGSDYPTVAAPTSFRIDPPLPPPPPPIGIEVRIQTPTVQWVPHALAPPGSRAFDRLIFQVRIKNISKELVFLCFEPVNAIHPIQVLREGKRLPDLGGLQDNAPVSGALISPEAEVHHLWPGGTLERRMDGLRSEEILGGQVRTHGFIDAGKGHYRVQFEYRCGDAGAYAGPLTSNWVSFEVN